ncbi:hypothetical protein ACFE04_022254 [Oxalis oulophora]
MIAYYAMPWLKSIPFTKSSSMKSSSSSTTDDLYSSKKSDHRHHRHKKFRFMGSRGFFGSHKSSSEERKLRQLSDQGCVFDALAAPMPSPTLSTATSVPLPLPLPMPDGGSEGDHSRSPSPKEHKVEVRNRASHDGCIKSVFSARETRSATPSGKVRQSFSDAASSQDDFVIDCPTRSAPTSHFASPVLSPQRSSTADLYPYYTPTNGKGQVWSAPEMATYDMAGFPPPAFFDFTTYSTESSPLHSPNRSPRGRSKSPSRPTSPLHMKLSPDTPAMRRESSGAHPNGQRESNNHVKAHRETHVPPHNSHRENNSHINVHPLPLPLPPGAPANPAQQVTPKSDVVPMNSQWQKGKLIGRGTFGSVYVASNRETGALCAMKEVEIFPDDPKSAECIKQLQQVDAEILHVFKSPYGNSSGSYYLKFQNSFKPFLLEIKVLSQLKHLNIVQYYGSEIIDDKFNIYLEYVHPGSINKYIRDHCGAMTESIIRNFTRHILSGLAYLHSTKTVHRDIKGANLLVDAFGVVKLADFGMAKHLTGQRADLSLKGSPYWMAPELMQAVMQKDNSSDLAFAIDIWSLGCTIIEMFDGKPPWSEFEGVSALDRLFTIPAAAMFKVMRDTPPIPETLSPEGKDFLRCCFQRNPAERPTASKLLEHRFVKGSLVPTDSSCREALNAMKLTEKPRSPRRRDIKLDQLPVFPMSRSTKKVPDSELQRSHHETSDFTTAPRVSPRSTLEPFPAVTVAGPGQPMYYSSPSPITINSRNTKGNQMIK